MMRIIILADKKRKPYELKMEFEGLQNFKDVVILLKGEISHR